MTPTIPEAAVQNALDAFEKTATTRDGVIAALTAALPFLTGVTVKKLEWNEVSEPNENIRYTHITADSSVGQWSIEWKSWKDYDDKTIFLNGDFIGNGGDNLEAAKAAAQADYEARFWSMAEVLGNSEQLETVGRYETRYCKDIPTNCCDYGVVDLPAGIEVCRVWKEEDARRIAELLNGHPTPSPRAQALEEAAKLLEREADELDGLVDSVSHHLRSKAKTIRALSQPVADGVDSIEVTPSSGCVFADMGVERPVEGGWLPIETAPKGTAPHHWDAPSILVSDGQSVDQAEWKGDDGEPYWHATGGKRKSGNFLGYEPTHWRPLPQAPGVAV